MKEHASLFKCRLYYIKSIYETIDSGFNECIMNYQSYKWNYLYNTFLISAFINFEFAYV